MYETVTVNEAIKRGNRMINYPVMIIMFAPISGSLYLHNHLNFPMWLTSVTFFAGFIVAWAYWSFMITKWRLWAFNNVRNVHELKRKAIEAKLIWKDGSFWEKTEIRTKADKEKLKLIEDKFNRPDVYVDDYLIPSETLIYYSKGKTYFETGLGLCFLFGGIYLFVFYSRIVGALSILFGGYTAYKGYQKTADTEPQIIIGDKGIQTINAPFCAWAGIEYEEVVGEREDKATVYYFTYNYSGGHGEKLKITDYNITKSQLENLLHVYRTRSEKRKSSSA